MEGTPIDAWDAALYDGGFGYVSRLGQGVVELLDPQEGERILDLGCGTGDLTREIASSGARPLGIDSSPAMIEAAARKYPDLRFAVEDGETFRSDERFDAVFSNAALHWMDGERAAETVWLALSPGGRFVAEFGGKGNVETIVRLITEVLAERGISASDRNPWYFPSIGEYASLLEGVGFRVRYAAHFDRPTPLEGEDGLARWLDVFGGSFFRGLSRPERSALYERIQERAEPLLYEGGRPYADYKRIRVLATKG